MGKIHFFVVSTCVILMCSCGSSKNISYFQDLDNSLQQQVAISDSLHPVTIKPGDELAIVVSSVEPQVVVPFNLPSGQGKVSTYIVDGEGDINFPTLGKINLKGLSIDESVDLLQSRLEEYVKDPIVNMQILNFRISVLGAVNAPGPVFFTGQRISILDALANARDLNIYGQRDNVLLIREVDGKREFIRFDLTKSDQVFTSPYFYLQQNDIVYVEPNKQYQKDAGMTQTKQFNLTLITTAATTLISALSLIIAVTRK